MTSLENAITGNVIVYQVENELFLPNVLFKDETFWMIQKTWQNYLMLIYLLLVSI